MLEQRLKESENKLRLSSARNIELEKDKEIDILNEKAEADQANGPIPTDGPLATEAPLETEPALIIDEEE